MKRKATAVWKGSGKEGKGELSTQSPVIKSAAYSYGSRFEQGAGTNPEELIAAAHAGCFAMKLSFILGEAGFTPDQLQVECTITLGDGVITESHLALKATVPNITKDKLDACAEEARKTCPISRSLNTKITLETATA